MPRAHAKQPPTHPSGKGAAAPARKEQRDGKPGGGEAGTAQGEKNRRFPFRKLADIEGEIFQRESRIERLNEELGDQATFRDGGRVRTLKQELAEQQSALEEALRALGRSQRNELVGGRIVKFGVRWLATAFQDPRRTVSCGTGRIKKRRQAAALQSAVT